MSSTYARWLAACLSGLAMLGGLTSSAVGAAVAVEAQADEAEALDAEPTPDDENLLKESATPEADPRAFPPPGVDVMQPTRHGLALTPKLAEYIGRQMADEGMGADLKLDAQQKTRMAEAITRRILDAQRKRGRQVGDGIEHLFEVMLSGQTIDRESARTFSEKISPALGAVDEFMDGLLQDAKPLLSESQFADLEKDIQRERVQSQHFREKMKRWEQGEVKEGENWMAAFQDDTPEEPDKPKAPPKTGDMQQAEWKADSNIRDLGPVQWHLFLDRAKAVFAFTPEQVAAGDALLVEYREKAELIMTDAWRQHVRANRIRSHAKEVLTDQSLKPWLYHLDREYREMTAPLKQLGREFHRAVVDLATDEQRGKALAEMQKFADDHGMRPDEMATVVSKLAAGQVSQPSN